MIVHYKSDRSAPTALCGATDGGSSIWWDRVTCGDCQEHPDPDGDCPDDRLHR